ncbi:hypothetical protein CHLNCDRAFT_25066 [Chlorella variabilis]|uniref:Uncharacterized protein n=1 Tax=Chlorella variabilis TaxID=554065 RepID=E1ZIU0_CHLVA|nr:hypothetical protein CHLNCDRAFT_25066 [Chlorella variabilis]EFN54392.1 hypothetical protein CHLNCDRAFT_25066 [Chlorella variabilis]|eukprot:XP_005846494.1 hypothetical protein CHLNCDRAFT_25066 [Chlorella variabilis]
MLACRAIWLEAGRVTCDALSRSLSTHSLACDLRHARRLPPCRLLACFVLLLVGRVVNIGLPLAYKKVVDRLAETGVAAAAAASENMLAAATWLQGSSGKGGILANVRDLLWIPLQQASQQAKQAPFGIFEPCFIRQTNPAGKVMRVLDRGTSSIQDVMQAVLFNIGPQILDMIAACMFMAIKLQPWTAIIVTVTVVTYIPITFIITEYCGKVRKQMNKLDNEKEGKATDMLLNYETVKLFTSERFELGSYGRAIDAYQTQEYLQLACISLLNIAQSVLVFVGLALGEWFVSLTVCVRGILAGKLSVGDAVLFLSLMNSLMAPLSFFGSYYRQVQKGLIDMENMFDLLARKPEVDDAPDACQLEVTNGQVEFANVSFSYGRGPPVLRNISFEVQGGRTLALVGATGSGKSTVLRLLLRFYDPTAGRVLVEGTDISRCTQSSLRRHIAVVPQDTVLFNDTIRYNVRYGRTSASDEEVEEAARVAHIHAAVVRRFPDGYDTLVGERGLRLSGGEKQRVAFARAVLRNPAILVLDEATSALDSMTERMIQSLAGMRQQNTTTIIVAHRLSTIADADVIVVLEGGSVAEAGSHLELLQRGGLYAAMWQRQQEAGSFSQHGEAVQLAAAAAVAAADGRQAEAGHMPSRAQSPLEPELSRATSDGTFAEDGDITPPSLLHL